MTENKYEKLNNYLSDLFSYLYPLDSFLLENLKTIILLNRKIKDFLKEYDLEDEHQNENLTFEEVYLKARECILDIQPNYIELFDPMISNGILNFDYEKTNSRSTSMSIYLEGRDEFKSEINLSRSFSYYDVISLIHEFFHIINGRVKSKSINRHILGEFISMYFEMKAIEYIENKESINLNYCYKKRLKNTYLISSRFNLYSLPLFLFENNGKITKDGFTFINEFLFPVEEEYYEKCCRCTLNNLDYMKNRYMNSLVCGEVYNHKTYLDKIGRLYAIDYHYILGSALAFYAKKYVSIEKMLWLNSHINDDDIGNMNIIDVLKKINIDIESTCFENQLINILEEKTSGYVKKR